MSIALIPVASASDLERQQRERFQQTQNRPVIQGLSSHVRERWNTAKDGRRDLEERMSDCLRQRRGEYSAQKMAEINEQGGSKIFVQLTSVKCRGATSWLRDTLLGSGSDKPWTFEATPEPDLPPEMLEQLQMQMAQQVFEQMQMTGQSPDQEQLGAVAAQMKDAAMRQLKEEADVRVKRMERKTEDQLAEGGWIKAFNEFLDDLVTFPFAAMKGPVKRRRKKLMWQDGALTPGEEIRNEWERVDPFMLYWAPWASDIQDGFVIERHKLTKDDLQLLIGVPGYDEDSIRSVLSDYNSGGLREWLWIDSEQADAEGKDVTETTHTDDLIDALQLWDSVDGKTLREWGLSEAEVPDADLNYPCEVWLVGSVVIRAVLNYDPMGRKPYFVTAYERTPGSIAGRGVPDLCRDSQDMVNAAARALANNMGISSGPQVGVNVGRLPAGEDITQMYPWKIWQFEESDINTSTPPISFFQPQSNSQELMSVFEKFANRADEDTMLPRYMTGEHTPGVGRTSSGLSMLISNAGKGIKQVITNIDRDIIVPAVERQYYDNLRYHGDDPDIVGDLHIVAKGAVSLVLKEAEAIRRNEFLQLVLNSPVAQNIVGMGGTAELLREAASNLDGNVDKIVPDRQQISTMEQQQQIIQQLQQQLQMLAQQMGLAGQGAQGSAPPPAPSSRNILPDGSEQGGREGNYVSPRPNGR